MSPVRPGVLPVPMDHIARIAPTPITLTEAPVVKIRVLNASLSKVAKNAKMDITLRNDLAQRVVRDVLSVQAISPVLSANLVSI